jgi:hypothetical protein
MEDLLEVSGAAEYGFFLGFGLMGVVDFRRCVGQPLRFGLGAFGNII